MPDGYSVDTGKLSAHKQDADQAAATGNQVVDAGNQVTPGGWDNAFGLMFQMFPQVTRPVTQTLLSFAKDAVQVLQNTADAVGDASKQYDNADQAAIQALQDLEKQLEEVPDVQVGGVSPGTGVPRTEGTEV